MMTRTKDMRILWFVNTPSNYRGGKSLPYNGGGWISSLENELRKVAGIRLGVAFTMAGAGGKVEDGQVTYYPIDIKEYSILALTRRTFGLPFRASIEKREWRRDEAVYMKVVDDFKPDVIEVFGSEKSFGLIASKVNVPLVLHIQGLLTPYLMAYLPPFMSWGRYYWTPFNFYQALRKLAIYADFQFGVAREQEIARRVRYFIGRTDWDRRVVSLLNPQAEYIYGSEVLRSEFYKPCERKLPERCVIVTTMSKPPYKGFDILLKTAAWLRRTGMDFEWRVYGNVQPAFAEKLSHIKHKDVNVRLMGVATSGQLREAFLTASMYVHPSYIDNSPNSLCEAQISACPVVATDVGGVSSLVRHGVTGFLVPANDPFQMAYFLRLLFEDKELNQRIGKQAREEALRRHDPQSIVSKLLKDYEIIIKNRGTAEG